MDLMSLDPVVQVGGATSGAALGLYLIRKLWRTVSAEHVETRKDGAEVALFTNLRAEITRMGEDIATLKKNHTSELKTLRESNDSRMGDLETQVSGLESAMSSMKQAAMDAYLTLSDDKSMPASSKTAIAGYLRTIMHTAIPKPEHVTPIQIMDRRINPANTPPPSGVDRRAGS